MALPWPAFDLQRQHHGPRAKCAGFAFGVLAELRVNMAASMGATRGVDAENGLIYMP